MVASERMLQEARGEEKKRQTCLTTLVIEGGVGDEGLHVNVPNTIQQKTQVLRGQPLQRGWRNHVKHTQPQVLKHNTHTERYSSGGMDFLLQFIFVLSRLLPLNAPCISPEPLNFNVRSLKMWAIQPQREDLVHFRSSHTVLCNGRFYFHGILGF